MVQYKALYSRVHQRDFIDEVSVQQVTHRASIYYQDEHDSGRRHRFEEKVHFYPHRSGASALPKHLLEYQELLRLDKNKDRGDEGSLKTQSGLDDKAVRDRERDVQNQEDVST